MAQTTGLVQRLTVLGGNSACLWIGPSPTNTALLIVQNDGSATGVAFASSMIDALAAAMVGQREVVAFHADGNSSVTGVQLNPA